MGKYKTNASIWRQLKLIYDWHKIVAIRTETVHPQDGMSWVSSALEFDGG